MTYATLCSGIGAPECAIGHPPVFVSEIEPFPCAVLAHHYQAVPNYGDMTKWRDWPHHDLDLLIAGTPCQAFSVAGLRQGTNDARGNLTLEFVRIVDAFRPRFVLWENVPGVLSDRTNAFGHLLAGLAGADDALVCESGRWPNAGFVSGPKRQVAYRILDAQYFGVPQRRRRVWLCAGDLERGAGDWACAAALFPEPESVRRDPAACCEAREEAAARAGVGSHGVISGAVSAKWAKGTGGPAGDECYNLVAHALRGEGVGAEGAVRAVLFARTHGNENGVVLLQVFLNIVIAEVKNVQGMCSGHLSSPMTRVAINRKLTHIHHY